MSAKEFFRKIERGLAEFRHVIGILILISLLATAWTTYNWFEKQEQIINTCGYTDGKIKCVCTQEAWDQYIQSKEQPNLLPSEINISGG